MDALRRAGPDPLPARAGELPFAGRERVLFDADDHCWMTVEEYLKEHHDVDVSHGLCLERARDVHGLACNGE